MGVISTWIPIRATDSTDASYPARIATATRPSGDGVIDFGVRSAAPGTITLLPFGTGADDNTFKMRVLGWSKTTSGLWVQTLIAEMTCTLSSLTGVLTYVPSDLDFLADIISVTIGIGIVTLPTSNTAPANVVLGIGGYQIIEILFNMNSSATAANCLYKLSE